MNFELGLSPWTERIAKSLLGLDRVQAKYLELQDSPHPNAGPAAFCQDALTALGHEIEWPLQQLEALRQLEGPVLVVANHPFGAIDALVMMALMGKMRDEFKFVGNSILEALPELLPALIAVDIMGQPSPAANFAANRNMLRYLDRGGMIGLFPGGEVAELEGWTAREVTERSWHRHLGVLVRKSKATVLPLYFEGQNSAVFRYVGLAAPKLRVALLVRELLKNRQFIRFRLGPPIAFTELEPHEDPTALAQQLRAKTLSLRSR